MKLLGVGFSIAGFVLALAPLSMRANPDVQRVHERWRELTKPEIARWFIPGPLGYEPGVAAPEASDRAYRTRFFTGLARSEEKAWGLANGLTEPVAFSHHLAEIFPAALFDIDPALFAEEKGARLRPLPDSWSWNPDLGNPDVAEQASEAARDFFKFNSSVESFSVGVNDGIYFGESVATLHWIQPMRWFRNRPDYSDLVFQFTNRVATNVATDFPGKSIGALAYYWCENVPRFPVEKNVMPFLTADRSQGFDPKFWREEKDLQRTWGRQRLHRLGLYDYIYGHGFLIPRQHTRLLAENLRFARSQGFTDYFAEVEPNWGLDGPQPWLVAQLLLDPQASPRRLLDEYYRRYFREAGRPMRRFFELSEAQWMQQTGAGYWLRHYRRSTQASVFPAEVCRTLRGLLDQAVRKATDETVKARVALVSDAFRATEGLVTLIEARTTLTRRVLNNDLPTVVDFENYTRVRAKFVADVAEITRRQPLALSHPAVGDFMRDDPTFALFSVWLSRGDLPAEVAENPLTEAPLRLAHADTIERFENGSFEGGLNPGLRIAGLAYALDLPAGWQSSSQPAQSSRGAIRAEAARSGAAGLRVQGENSVRVSQRQPVAEGDAVEAGLWVRGRVGPASFVRWSVRWLDEAGRVLEPVVPSMSLPAGEWPRWVQLKTGGVAPANARAVMVLLTVANQEKDEAVDVDDASLRVVARP